MGRGCSTRPAQITRPRAVGGSYGPRMDRVRVRAWGGTLVFLVLTPGVVAGLARADGTPAPPAPTAHLVVVGPYRYVRNPMYLAVLAIILGQALLSRSWGALVYAAVVLVAVATFVLGY